MANRLEDEIRHGVLQAILPSERQLVDRLQVSRRTIRAATAILAERRLICTAPRCETRILALPQRGSARIPRRTIGLILPGPLDERRPFGNLVDELRVLLDGNGFRLETFFERSFLARRPVAALERLVTRFPCDGWILASATRACQAWFLGQSLPTVLNGTAYEGIDLPQVDIDMRATARHAAHRLRRKGHQRMALIIEDTGWAGYRKTEQGFLEAIEECEGEAVGVLARHRGDIKSLRPTVARLMELREPPTALFIVNPYHYLAVAAILSDLGVKVPDEVSLLCRDDDPCLHFLPVEPSRYRCDPRAMAREIFALLMHAVISGAPRRLARSVLMLPEYIEGASVALRRMKVQGALKANGVTSGIRKQTVGAFRPDGAGAR